MAYLVTVTLALDVASEAEAADGTNELLRELQRSFTPSSCLLDYAIDDTEHKELDVTNYQEGDAWGPDYDPESNTWSG